MSNDFIANRDVALAGRIGVTYPTQDHGTVRFLISADGKELLGIEDIKQGGGIAALSAGGTGADLSATGPGWLRQSTKGSVCSVGAIEVGDVSGAVDLSKNNNFANGTTQNFDVFGAGTGSVSVLSVDALTASTVVTTASLATGAFSADGGLLSSNGFGGLVLADILTMTGDLTANDISVNHIACGGITAIGSLSTDNGQITSDGSGVLNVVDLVIPTVGFLGSAPWNTQIDFTCDPIRAGALDLVDTANISSGLIVATGYFEFTLLGGQVVKVLCNV